MRKTVRRPDGQEQVSELPDQPDWTAAARAGHPAPDASRALNVEVLDAVGQLVPPPQAVSRPDTGPPSRPRRPRSRAR